jgi:hypothetical protein
MTNQDGSVFVVQYKTIDDEESSNLHDDNKQLSESTQVQQPTADVGQSADKDILESFISGSNCLTGVRTDNFFKAFFFKD